MIYHRISSEILIAKIDNSYTITGVTDWITRLPEWVADAMAEVDMPLAYSRQEPYKMEIVARRGKLPCNVERVLFITKDGKSMSYIQDGVMRQPNSSIEMSNVYFYEYTKSGHIICNFESGTTYVYYKGLDYEYNKVSRQKYPYVPYSRVLLNALESYIIKRILIKGGSVLGQSLAQNNPYTNPALNWEMQLKKVRIALLNDYDEAIENIDESMRGFVISPKEKRDIRDNLNTIE